MLEKRTKIAVVGVGEIGTRAHIPAYLRNKKVDLVALVDSNRTRVEKAAKKFGVDSFFLTIDELFKNQHIDAVSICTPPNTHAEIALKALANDVHVLCEKPMATTTDEGMRMFKASREKQKILMIGFNLRFQPNYAKTAELVRRGELGHVHLVEFNLQSPNPLVAWCKSPWVFDPASGGGVLLDKGSHVFDLINYVFDDFPQAIMAVSSTYFHSDVEDSCVCVLEYPENRIGIGVMSWLSFGAVEQLNVFGTSQSLSVSPSLILKTNLTDIPEISLWRKATEMVVSLKFPNLPMLQNNKVDLFQLEIDNFVAQIRGNQSYSPTALSGLNVIATCDAAKKSLETGKKANISSLKELY